MTKQKLEQRQTQSLSHQQIQFLKLLQLPIIELEKRIEDELEENPALEEEENDDNQTYFQSAKRDFSNHQIEDKTEVLSDFIKKQLVGLPFDDELLFLIKYLADSLDENGFLTRNLVSICSDLLISNNLTVSELQIKNALSKLQELEPIGVGARSLQECLQIQIKKIHPKNKLALTILSEYYQQFSNKNFEQIIKTLNISEQELKETYLLIKGLNPFPANGFINSSHMLEYIYPDFTTSIRENKITLTLNKSNTKPIKVSEFYNKLLKETKDKNTKEFLKQKVEKASWFKNAITKREETLRNVMTAIISVQENYFLSGDDKELKPMKLADISNIVNMDISTISRVSNSKYVETHFGTFKIKELFSDAYRKDNGEVISTNEIKKQLESIINSEDKRKPYTDEQLSDMLGNKGYHIARRTVAKYRGFLAVETAKLRREL